MLNMNSNHNRELQVSTLVGLNRFTTFSSVTCNKAKVGAYATVSPFSGDLLGDSRMSNVLDKSFIHRSYPKLAYGSIYTIQYNTIQYNTFVDAEEG